MPTRAAISGGRGLIVGSRRHIAWDQAIAHAVLLTVALASILPFVWMVLGSFKTYRDLAANPWLPRPWIVGNYVEILKRADFAKATLNSVFVAVPRVVSGCLTSAGVAYAFAKYRFPGRDLLFTILLSTMMVPFTVTLVPLYVTLANLQLVNNLTGLIIFGFYNTFGIFLLRQSIAGIPNDLIEAARMDGAKETWIFTRLILPLSGAPLAALAVVTFLGSWDDFILPSIVLTKPGIQTLPLVLAGMRGLYWQRYELYCAGSMLTVVPVMVMYALLQRYFIEGIALTGLKG
ncbi:MAG: carbohydrate ABC transporter permease [Anaerolineae bacterium]